MKIPSCTWYDTSIGHRDFLHTIFRATYTLENDKKSSAELEYLWAFIAHTATEQLSAETIESILQLAYHLGEFSPNYSHDGASARLWLNCKSVLVGATVDVPHNKILSEQTMHILCAWRDLLNPESVRT